MVETDSPLPDFHESRLALAVEQLTEEQIHRLPFGAIRLNPAGTAVFYSESERRLSGYRKEVIGHDFFVEVAPCMNNPNFRGRIDRAVASGTLDIAFNYLSELPTAADLEVRVQSATGGGCWIFLKRNE